MTAPPRAHRLPHASLTPLTSLLVVPLPSLASTSLHRTNESNPPSRASSSSSTVARASLASLARRSNRSTNAPRLPPRSLSLSPRPLPPRASSTFVAVVDASTECGRRPTFPENRGEIRRGGRDGESRPVDGTTRPTRRRADPAASSRPPARVTQFTDHDSTYRLSYSTHDTPN